RQGDRRHRDRRDRTDHRWRADRVLAYVARVLDSLFLGPTIEAVADALKAAPAGPIAVIGQPRLARGLVDRALPVITIEDSARPLRTLKGERLVARADALPIAERPLRS